MGNEKKQCELGVKILKSMRLEGSIEASISLAKIFVNGHRHVRKDIEAALPYIDQGLRANNVECIKILNDVILQMNRSRRRLN